MDTLLDLGVAMDILPNPGVAMDTLPDSGVAMDMLPDLWHCHGQAPRHLLLLPWTYAKTLHIGIPLTIHVPTPLFLVLSPLVIPFIPHSRLLCPCRSLPAENWGGLPGLACDSCRTAGRGSESSPSHRYPEALHQVRVELDDLRKLLSRLEQDSLRTREAIEFLEQKLNRTAADGEVARNGLNQNISDLSTRLTRAQWDINALQNITDQAPQHGHVADERSLTLQGPWEGELLSPPAPFVDEGGDWPLLREAANATGVSQAAGPLSSEGGANQEETGWPLTERPLLTTTFTPWDTHTEGPGALDWFVRSVGWESHVGGRKEQAGGPSDPFGPLAPERHPVTPLVEGGQSEAGSGRQQESLGPRPCHWASDPWGRPEPEAGCCGEAQVQGASRPALGLPGAFRHRLKASQALLQIPVVEHDLVLQSSCRDSERRARQWVNEWRPAQVASPGFQEGCGWPAGAKSRAGVHSKVQGPGQDSEQVGLKWAQGWDPYLREFQASCPKFRGGRD
ncbi:uncharacterized protein [Narcine bancroftii]|uniref:uncharacterized protein n=1 Tax=Narcine bancroftii TaxID=1343680 RepID=UPI003831B837